MTTEIVQVRDVPADDVAVLRARAASRHMSLSAYLRELIHDETSSPTMGEVLSRIAARDAVEATEEDVRLLIADGRR